MLKQNVEISSWIQLSKSPILPKILPCRVACKSACHHFQAYYGSLEGPFKITTSRVPWTQYLNIWWQKDVFPTLNFNILYGNDDLLSCMQLGISAFCFNMTTCWDAVNSISQHLVEKWGHDKLQATQYLNILLKMMTRWVTGNSAWQYLRSKWRLLSWRQLDISTFCFNIMTC